MSCNEEGRFGKESVMQSRFWTGGLETAQSKSGVNFDCNNGRVLNRRNKKQQNNKAKDTTTKENPPRPRSRSDFRLAVVGAVRETLVLDTKK